MSGSLVESGRAWYVLDARYEDVGCNKGLQRARGRVLYVLCWGWAIWLQVCIGTGRRRIVDMHTETKELYIL